MADKRLCVLSYDKTYPTCDVRGTQGDRVRSQAQENLPKFSPIFYHTLGHGELRPSRELGTPEDVTAAWHGLDRLILDATARAAHRSQEEAKQQEHSSGKKTAPVEQHGHGPA